MSSFPVLGDTHYLGYLGPMSHRGANPTTHIADIRYPVQHAGVKSVVKLLPTSGLQACNEAIAWLMLRALGVHAPRTAAIMVMSEKKAKAVLGARLVTQEFVSGGHVIAWASQLHEWRSIRALFAGTAADDKWLQVLRTDAGTAVAAFDEMLHNRDRNTGNILYVNDGSCFAIDHEQIFDYQNWLAADLKHSDECADSLRVLERAYRSDKLKADEWKRITNAMIYHSQGHGEALNACRKQVEELLGRLYQSSPGSAFASRILNFISARCTDQWMQARVGALT